MDIHRRDIGTNFIKVPRDDTHHTNRRITEEFLQD